MLIADAPKLRDTIPRNFPAGDEKPQFNGIARSGRGIDQLKLQFIQRQGRRFAIALGLDASRDLVVTVGHGICAALRAGFLQSQRNSGGLSVSVPYETLEPIRAAGA